LGAVVIRLADVSGHAYTPPIKHEWQDNALCFGKYDLFFNGNRAEALKICGECDVQMQCLTYTMEKEDKWGRAGISGGLTPAQRKALSELMKESPSLTLEEAYNEIISRKPKKRVRAPKAA